MKMPLTVNFNNGLPGLENCHVFTLSFINGTESPFYWLESSDVPGIQLILISPFQVFPDYEFYINEADQKELRIEKPDEVLVFTTVTIPEKAVEATTNLLGPIIINPCAALGKQVVLSSGKYTTKHKIFAER